MHHASVSPVDSDVENLKPQVGRGANDPHVDQHAGGHGWISRRQEAPHLSAPRQLSTEHHHQMRANTYRLEGD